MPCNSLFSLLDVVVVLSSPWTLYMPIGNFVARFRWPSINQMFFPPSSKNFWSLISIHRENCKLWKLTRDPNSRLLIYVFVCRRVSRFPVVANLRKFSKKRVLNHQVINVCILPPLNRLNRRRLRKIKRSRKRSIAWHAKCASLVVCGKPKRRRRDKWHSVSSPGSRQSVSNSCCLLAVIRVFSLAEIWAKNEVWVSSANGTKSAF